MHPQAADPSNDRATLVTEELRTLRRRGLMHLRHLDLPVLLRIAHRCGYVRHAERPWEGIRSLLMDSVDALGGGNLGDATAALFGLRQGLGGVAPQDLRQLAAKELVAGTDKFPNAETFRKNHEPVVIAQLVDEILRRDDDIARHPTDTEVPRNPEHDVAALLDFLGPDRHRRFTRRYGPYVVEGADPGMGDAPRVFVDAGPVEELRGVQVLVSSENVYLEPDRMFSSSLSGHLRRAAAERNPEGFVLRDVVGEELAAWVKARSHPGVSFPAGTVALTSPGALAAFGVVKILHAAVAFPRAGTSGYDIPPDGVVRAVRRCFELARAARAAAGRSHETWHINFPLFGAGEGGQSSRDSFALLSPTVLGELAADPTWHVHISTWTGGETLDVLQALSEGLRAARG